MKSVFRKIEVRHYPNAAGQLSGRIFQAS